MAVTRIDKDILGKRLAEINPALEEAYMTILEAINQEAETRGRAHTLTMQLEAKFGPLPTWARESLDNANLEQLDSWALEFVTATTLRGVFGA